MAADQTQVAVVSDDMIFASRITAAVEQRAAAVHTFTAAEAFAGWLRQAGSAAGGTGLVVVIDLRQPEPEWRRVVDLAVGPDEGAGNAGSNLDGGGGDRDAGAGEVEVIAAGPHEDANLLHEALEAGCGAALPNSRIGPYLREHLG